MNNKFEELLSILIQDSDDDYFAYYGLRATTELHYVGEELECSYVWIDGEKTEEELNGTSSMGIMNTDRDSLVKAIINLGKDACEQFGIDANVFHSYAGTNFVLIKGDSAFAGEDKGESIIRNAFVVAVFNG